MTLVIDVTEEHKQITSHSQFNGTSNVPLTFSYIF